MVVVVTGGACVVCSVVVEVVTGGACVVCSEVVEVVTGGAWVVCDEDVVVEATGLGPFTVVHAENDPRKAAARLRTRSFFIEAICSGFL